MLRRLCRYLLITLLTLLSYTPSYGLGSEDVLLVKEDYDSLSRLSSEELMEAGRAYFEQRLAGKSLTCFTIVSQRPANDEESARLSIRALNNCACVYKFLYYDYTQAYEHFIKAYDLCESLSYQEFLPVIMVNLGDLLNDYSLNYDSQPLAEQARQLFTKAIQRAVETNNWELLTTAFFNLSSQNYSLDLDDYNVILSGDIPHDTPDLQYIRLQYQAIAYIQEGSPSQARQCFEQQLPVVSARWEPERDTMSTYMGIAHTYTLEGRHSEAVEYLERALHMATDYHFADYAAGICRQLSQNYQLMGDTVRAAQYRMLHLEKQEETHENRLANIAELNYIYQLHKQEEKAQQLAIRQQRLVYIITAIVFALLVMLISAYLLWRKNKQLLIRNKRLFEKTQQVIKAEEEVQKLRYSKSNLNDEQRETLAFRIQQQLDSADVVCQQDFNLSKLAKLVDSNTTYVSQVINEKYGTTFSNVLGRIRIKEACRRMNDSENYGNVTIEAIATGVGFKSRTSFVNAFKREVGLMPSEYLKMASGPNL